MEIHLISFGDKRYEKRIVDFKAVAIASSFFDKVTVFRALDMEPWFVKQFYEVLVYTRAGGFIWKPYFIKKALEEMNPGDILVYCDAGCHINKLGKERFDQYIRLLNESITGVLAFQLNHKEYKYTKREALDYFGASDTIINSGQLVATVIFLKKCDYSVRLIELWNDTLRENPNLFSDKINESIQHPDFVAHRHDQSIWSLLLKTRGADIIPDETYFDDFEQQGSAFPLWAARII